jgi:deoxyribose-phosphate aldolase
MAPSERSAAAARRLLPLIDLTSLNESDDDAAIARLIARAWTPFGHVAAVCVWPKFIAAARKALRGHRVPIAVVVNFPLGTGTVEAVTLETADAIAAGADEIDVVFPFRAFLEGDRCLGPDLLAACRKACVGHVMKVILETGQLESVEAIGAAARMAVASGADFLKTSTGKIQPGATLKSAAVLMDVIAQARADGKTVGLKASGGIRRMEEALAYLNLFEDRLGAGSARADCFRIGASSLIDEVLANIS